ncbi:MAG: major capsid protein [Microvirus sp.]|nr:MAG: major capsid protein [Microvirus sp.]
MSLWRIRVLTGRCFRLRAFVGLMKGWCLMPPVSMGQKNAAFQVVDSQRVPRAVFDLSHEKKITCDWGQLIPSLCLEMVPGDHFQISNDVVVRCQAMLAPLLHQVDLSIHYFFVPTRLCWPKTDTSGNDWESYISGGVDGLNAAVAPRYNPSGVSKLRDVGTLWDHFGLPTDAGTGTFTAAFPGAIAPIRFPFTAYALIFNEYYRDETLDNEIDAFSYEVQKPFPRSWAKDFFTSALPWPQRGTAPGVPITGAGSSVYTSAMVTAGAGVRALQVVDTASDNTIYTQTAAGRTNLLAALNNNSVAMNAASFSVNDLRLTSAIQRWMERNARGGVRYTEFLQSQFGVHPRDDRLQRPEYVGGVKQPIIFSEVLQTSATASQPTPAGTMVGHGLSVGRSAAGSYSAVEHGYLLGILSIMPVPAYQQGMDRMWLRSSRYDFYFPEFAGLGEQAVMNQELYVAADGANQTIFGYQGRYNEMRYQRNMVSGLFRSTLQYWHLGRVFASRPALNASFVGLGPAEQDSLKTRVSAVPSQNLFLISCGNVVRAVRPMPDLPVPGLNII